MAQPFADGADIAFGTDLLSGYALAELAALGIDQEEGWRAILRVPLAECTDTRVPLRVVLGDAGTIVHHQVQTSRGPGQPDQASNVGSSNGSAKFER